VRHLVAAGGLAIAARTSPRRSVGVVAALGTVFALGLLPGSAAAGTGWSGFTWTEVGNQNTVTFLITDSAPTQSWKSFFFQADGTPANSIKATSITVTVGSTTDITDCTQQTGTNALQIGCQGFVSGFLGVGKTVTLSWLASPPIQGNGGGYFGGTDFAGVSTAGAVIGPTIPASVCDWTVGFIAPPKYAHSFPIDYSVRVANAGDASCDPAPLTIRFTSPNPLMDIDTPVIQIPGLLPGASYTGRFSLEPSDPHEYSKYVWEGFHAADLEAFMPLDSDAAPVDESDETRIKLLHETTNFKRSGDLWTASCPKNLSDVIFRNCLENFVILFPRPAASARRYAAIANNQPLVVGSAHGTIKAGRTGPIQIKLNKTGHHLLRNHHKLLVTLIGTRRHGRTMALLKGHITLG
jgi:hypothetical protein